MEFEVNALDLHNKRFNLHFDAGHAWLKVSKETLALMDLKQRDFSSYSYQDDGSLYLEEDLDAGVFVKRARELSMNFEVIEIDDGNDSPIRNMSRVRGGAA